MSTYAARLKAMSTTDHAAIAAAKLAKLDSPDMRAGRVDIRSREILANSALAHALLAHTEALREVQS
jgi:hypothetical protein